MFCPNCGSNQGEGKRFCTACGTNLAAVSQALTGQIPQPNYYAPPAPHPQEIERQRQMAKGVRLSIIGGGIVALNFFSFIFSGFRSSPPGFLAFIGFILLAVGISKIISSRPPGETGAGTAQATPAPPPQAYLEIQPAHRANPQPVFSAASVAEPPAPRTSELEPVRNPAPSVTEDETRHLPHNASSR
jgi:hypothetical protein